NETIYGGAGDDKLYGESGNDILIGGAGDDYLSGGSGTDIYIYNRGDGNDTIYNYDSSASCGTDKLVFGEGIKAEEITARRNGNDLILTDMVTGQTITVQHTYFGKYGGEYFIETIEFADGTVWNQNDIMERVSVLYGSDGDDVIHGQSTIHGYSENETIYGGAGDDKLYGESGNDILIGGAGDDYLSGGSGTDIYIYNRGDGNDTIYNYDSSASCGTDILKLGMDVSDITFAKSGINLVISVLDENNTITVQNWYANKYHQLGNIITDDGYSLACSQVDLLIQAMASFESSTGLNWQDAVRNQDEYASSIVDQYWVKQVG
ncbi:MAG: hypothetical protein K2O32_05950, partial [Acetatifactor sp.]|nr:hypothetical protein [Acetatifactor sp.]